MQKIDFAYSTDKGYASIIPLYKHMKLNGWDTEIYHIRKHKFRNHTTLKKISNNIITAFDLPLKRLIKSGWNGNNIYIEHGISPMKYYHYKYKFFFESTLIFYPGEVFKRKMETINPNFKQGLLGGYPKIDELLTLEINKNLMIKDLGLDDTKPIILFAPTWGGKYSKNWGIHNARYFEGIPNVIIAPHSGDYKYAKRFSAILPREKSNLNELIHLADIVVSEISSVLAEAALLDKPVIQLILPTYPGCFPEKDNRKEALYISPNIIEEEIISTNREKQPFKIAFLKEEWILGHTTKPYNLQDTIKDVIKNPDKFKKERKYWGEQSCWKADGKTCERISRMIAHYLNTNEITQLD